MYVGHLKQAESPLVRAAMGALGTGMLISDQQAAQDALREAALDDLRARQLEHLRMAPVRRGLRGRGGSVPDLTAYGDVDNPVAIGFEDPLFKGGSLRAWSPGTELALPFEKGASANLELTKEALNLMGGLKAMTGRALQGGGAISHGVGRLVGAAGQGMAGAGNALSKGLTPTSRLLRAGAGETAQFAQAVKPSFGGMLQGAGQKLQNAGLGIGVAGQNVAQGGKAMAQGALAPAAATVATAAKPAAQAAAQTAAKPAAQAASKPFLSTGTQLKMLGTAGILGAGYLGYKGLQAGRDYMNQPAGAHHQGYVREGLSPHGY